MRRYPHRPVPEPLDTNSVPVVLTGIALWVVAGLILLLRHAQFARAGHGWWLWTCVAGIVIGFALIGYEVHRRARRRSAEKPAEPASAR
ncbi:DUF2530 domain-containing protein [Actinocatenispora rupis]|uniref:DUF2530 domain-containing protein n=1 Tax=Actinocatenispora rupis TaxID=519421 RepID=A0A8J3J894_9ACTN|nr:DUF2530 domain-containing protein [Actinocatenispora rupis]GID13780.1 DUF2530 domain-containing protein [Actinocatenispora rupis]